jgi:DNA-binding CsgD family transcriptional regulator
MGKTLRWERVRAVMKLLNERRELGCRTEAARQHVATSLLDIVGAAIGVIVLDSDYRMGTVNSVSRATLAGFDDESRRLFDDHRTMGTGVNPFHQHQFDRVLSGGGEIFAATVSDLMPEKTWYASRWVSECALPARFDHFVGTATLIEAPAVVEGMAFMRAKGDKPFSDEDRDVLHLVHLESGRFFDNRPVLAPRVQATLDQLITGASDKEIAERLALSPHTVRQYVKTLLRAYGCTSRTELMARIFAQRAA